MSHMYAVWFIGLKTVFITRYAWYLIAGIQAIALCIEDDNAHKCKLDQLLKETYGLYSIQRKLLKNNIYNVAFKYLGIILHNPSLLQREKTTLQIMNKGKVQQSCDGLNEYVTLERKKYLIF